MTSSVANTSSGVKMLHCLSAVSREGGVSWGPLWTISAVLQYWSQIVRHTQRRIAQWPPRWASTWKSECTYTHVNKWVNVSLPSYFFIKLQCVEMQTAPWLDENAKLLYLGNPTWRQQLVVHCVERIHCLSHRSDLCKSHQFCVLKI